VDGKSQHTNDDRGNHRPKICQFISSRPILADGEGYYYTRGK